MIETEDRVAYPRVTIDIVAHTSALVRMIVDEKALLDHHRGCPDIEHAATHRSRRILFEDGSDDGGIAFAIVHAAAPVASVVAGKDAAEDCRTAADIEHAASYICIASGDGESFENRAGALAVDTPYHGAVHTLSVDGGD